MMRLLMINTILFGLLFLDHYRILVVREEDNTMTNNTNTNNNNGARYNANPKFGEVRTSKNGKQYTNPLMGFATVFYNGMRVSDIQVLTSSKGNVYLRFPGSFRKDKDGNYVVDKNGYQIYDDSVSPASKTDRDNIEGLIDAAMNDATFQCAEVAPTNSVTIHKNPRYGSVTTFADGNTSTNNLLAFATIYFNGLRINGVQILVSSKGNTYLRFPGTFRKDKDGEFVKDAQGYKVYDDFVAPTSKDLRDAINELVDGALEQASSKDPNFFNPAE